MTSPAKSIDSMSTNSQSNLKYPAEFTYHLGETVLLKIEGKEGWVKGKVANVINSRPKRKSQRTEIVKSERLQPFVQISGRYLPNSRILVKYMNGNWYPGIIEKKIVAELGDLEEYVEQGTIPVDYDPSCYSVLCDDNEQLKLVKQQDLALFSVRECIGHYKKGDPVLCKFNTSMVWLPGKIDAKVGRDRYSIAYNNAEYEKSVHASYIKLQSSDKNFSKNNKNKTPSPPPKQQPKQIQQQHQHNDYDEEEYDEDSVSSYSSSYTTETESVDVDNNNNNNNNRHKNQHQQQMPQHQIIPPPQQPFMFMQGPAQPQQMSLAQLQQLQRSQSPLLPGQIPSQYGAPSTQPIFLCPSPMGSTDGSNGMVPMMIASPFPQGQPQPQQSQQSQHRHGSNKKKHHHQQQQEEQEQDNDEEAVAPSSSQHKHHSQQQQQQPQAFPMPQYFNPSMVSPHPSMGMMPNGQMVRIASPSPMMMPSHNSRSNSPPMMPMMPMMSPMGQPMMGQPMMGGMGQPMMEHPMMINPRSISPPGMRPMMMRPSASCPPNQFAIPGQIGVPPSHPKQVEKKKK